jgi:hypothetical protein
VGVPRPSLTHPALGRGTLSSGQARQASIDPERMKAHERDHHSRYGRPAGCCWLQHFCAVSPGNGHSDGRANGIQFVAAGIVAGPRQRTAVVSALASGSPASIRSARDSVAGPVMTPYIRMQALLSEAAAASGQPEDVCSVTAISGGGYQICYPQGQGCQSFSAFRSDATGRITGMDVDGQPVSARLAVGPSDSEHGLVLTAVASYLGTSTGHVDVIFRVRNVSNHDISTGSPPFLPVFVTSPGGAQFNYDDFDSAIPGPLRPGESAAVVAAFHTRSFTGTISLRTNNGFEAILVSSRLRKPGT